MAKLHLRKRMFAYVQWRHLMMKWSRWHPLSWWQVTLASFLRRKYWDKDTKSGWFLSPKLIISGKEKQEASLCTVMKTKFMCLTIHTLSHVVGDVPWCEYFLFLIKFCNSYINSKTVSQKCIYICPLNIIRWSCYFF